MISLILKAFTIIKSGLKSYKVLSIVLILTIVLIQEIRINNYREDVQTQKQEFLQYKFDEQKRIIDQTNNDFEEFIELTNEQREASTSIRKSINTINEDSATRRGKILTMFDDVEPDDVDALSDIANRQTDLMKELFLKSK